MCKVLVAGLLLVLGYSTAQAQSPVLAFAGPYTPLGYCQMAATGTAKALTTANCASGAVPTGSTIAEICVETAGVRYRDDGTAPTAAIGVPVVPSATTPLCYAYAIKPMSAVQFIAISGSPVVNVSFYKTN